MATSTQKNDDIKNLLGKIPSANNKKSNPIIQEVAQTEEKKKTGRKNHRKEGVNYVRISPAIPEELKIEMDIAIKSTLKNSYPTIDTFIEEAIRYFLANQ
jgi:hypothetical protein